MAIPKLTRGNLRGVWCALIVPWTDRDELDEARFRKEVKSYANTGVHGVYTGGTTGEFYAQDDATYERLSKITCEEAHAIGLPVQIGTTALSTRTARLRTRTAIKAGADAIQIALPFWLQMSDDEVLQFTRDIADEAGATPIVLYLTMRSKRKIEAGLMGRIAAEVPTFIGTKDTGATPEQVKAMLEKAPDLAIFGGEDFYVRMPVGGTGGYCSVTGFNVQAVVKLYELCRAGKYEEAKPIHEAIAKLHREMWKEPWIEAGYHDSALDRVQRVAGGGDVGLNCQRPYKSCEARHVEKYLAWVRQNAPFLLPSGR